MPGGMPRTAWTSSCGASPPPFPCPLPSSSSPAPGSRPLCPRSPTLPPPPPCLRVTSLPPDSGSCAPPATCSPACVSYRVLSPPLLLPVPLPFPCACPPPLPLAPVPFLCSCPPPPLRAPWPFPCVCPPPAAARAFARLWCLPPSSAACHLPKVSFLPLPCASALCSPSRPTAVPPVSPGPCLDDALLQLRQRNVRRRVFQRWGADGPWPFLGEGGLWRVLLGAAHVGVAGLGAGAVLGALPALCCGRCGPWRLARRGALGPRRAHPARQWRAKGCSLACWSSGCGPMRPVRRRNPGPSCGGAAGAMACVAGAAPPAGTGSATGGSQLLGAARGCSAGGPTKITASASCRSSRSAETSPAHPGETGKQEWDRWRWRSPRWGEPLECDIAATLTGVRGCRCACPTTSQFIGGLPWVVLCGAGGGHGTGLSWAVGHPTALGSEAGEPLGPHAAP